MINHLIRAVEEFVGENCEGLPALIVLASRDHTAQINVQEGGLEPEVPQDQVP